MKTILEALLYLVFIVAVFVAWYLGLWLVVSAIDCITYIRGCV